MQRVLIVDDDPAYARTVARIAETNGLATRIATSAEECRAAFEGERPHLVVLDLHLGDSDGVELLSFLSGAGFPGPVVLLSGSDRRVLDAAMRVGGDLGVRVVRALEKPVRAADLSAALLQALRGTEAIDEETLRRAIDADELVLEFQPIVNRRGDVRGVEALLRWPHPVFGRIPTNAFIAIAEKNTELMDRLTYWVIRRAATAMAGWREAGLELAVGVNVSGRNLHDVDFPARFVDELRPYGLSPERFTIEVTETAASQDPVRTTQILTRLRIKGVELAIDDFGTGYSSLRALRQLPFSVVKIDQSFIGDLLSSPDSQAVVRAIIALAGAMGLRCIAEGVETAQTAQALRELGVDGLQGYYFAKPMPESALRAWMEERKHRTAE